MRFLLFSEIITLNVLPSVPERKDIIVYHSMTISSVCDDIDPASSVCCEVFDAI